MAIWHLDFPGVKGYSTPERAAKRGMELQEEYSGVEFRWAVIVLENGRYAPMVILNNNIPGGPGMFLGERNICLAN